MTARLPSPRKLLQFGVAAVAGLVLILALADFCLAVSRSVQVSRIGKALATRVGEADADESKDAQTSDKYEALTKSRMFGGGPEKPSALACTAVMGNQACIMDTKTKKSVWIEVGKEAFGAKLLEITPSGAKLKRGEEETNLDIFSAPDAPGGPGGAPPGAPPGGHPGAPPGRPPGMPPGATPGRPG
jgi:hypothetical protein